MRLAIKKTLLLSFFVCFIASTAYSQKAMVLEDGYAQLDLHYSKEDYRACLKLERELLTSIQSRVDTIVAETYYLLGDSYFHTGNVKKAIDYFEKELVIRRKLDLVQTEGFSNGLYNLTAIYRDEGEYKLAKEKGEELLKVDSNIKGKESEAYLSSVQFVLDVLERSGDILKAKDLAEKTLNEIDKRNPLYPLLLSKVADLYSILGLYTKSEAAFLEALPLLKEFDENSMNAINASINLSSLYINQGRYPEAEELLLHSCTVLKSMKEEEAEASYITALNSLALVQEAMARYEEAEINLREVRSLIANDTEKNILISPLPFQTWAVST